MTPLPILDPVLVAADTFEWPQPPFAHRRMMEALPTGAQPCRLDTLGGATVDAELIAFDPDSAQLRVAIAGGQPLAIPFERFRRLTLTTPWRLARRARDVPLERVPAAAQERDYRIELHGDEPVSGRTMGHLATDAGLYLYPPSDDGRSVQRVFVPRAMIASMHFGKSAAEAAAERWVATREALVAAVEAQRRAPIVSVGDALIELGFVTRSQIEQALAQQGPERKVPLGELLVAAGYLDRDDLQTALAHKMGYPVVDLTRFPIDATAARRLSRQAILEHRALPLMQHGLKLIVAVDDLARIPPLKALQGLAGLEVVPALAPRGRLALVLSSLAQRLGSDVWASNVPLQLKKAYPLAA